jgi:Flp pilus assembly protein TadG
LATAVRRRLGRARGEDGERGAVLVEAAIVIPLLMLITLGIIEYGSAYQQDAAVAAASRSGARVASALPKTDFGCTPVTSCSGGGTDSAVTVANAVSTALQSVGSAAPQKLVIYDADPDADGNGAPNFTGCTHCMTYTWNTSTKQFNTTKSSGTGWLSTGQYACAANTNPHGDVGPEAIGVYVQMTHTAVTHLFGGNKTLSGTTVMRFEPNVSSTCANTTT